MVTRRRVVAASLALVVLVGTTIALQLTVGSSKDTDVPCGGAGACTGEPDESDDSAAATPEDNCKHVVTTFLLQVPQALRDGYSAGVKTDQVGVEYGYSSKEFFAVTQLQSELLGNIAQNGDPDGQTGLILRKVPQWCVGATR